VEPMSEPRWVSFSNQMNSKINGFGFGFCCRVAICLSRVSCFFLVSLGVDSFVCVVSHSLSGRDSIP
jgi:hypothetical protein